MYNYISNHYTEFVVPWVMTLPSDKKKKVFFQSALFPFNMKVKMLREFEDWLLNSNIPRVSEVDRVNLDDHHPWLIKKPLIKYVKDSTMRKLPYIVGNMS